MTKLILILTFIVLAFLCSPAQSQQEYVDIIVKLDTPKDGGKPTIGGKTLRIYHPLLVDGTKTVYYARVSTDYRDIVLAPLFAAAKNGDTMWATEKAWNEFYTKEKALAEKVLLYDKTSTVTVDGKPTEVTESVTIESAKATVIGDLDKAKIRVPVKLSGTESGFDPKDIDLKAVEVEK